jgi:hypothetical protein
MTHAPSSDAEQIPSGRPVTFGTTPRASLSVRDFITSLPFGAESPLKPLVLRRALLAQLRERKADATLNSIERNIRETTINEIVDNFIQRGHGASVLF